MHPSNIVQYLRVAALLSAPVGSLLAGKAPRVAAGQSGNGTGDTTASPTSAAHTAWRPDRPAAQRHEVRLAIDRPTTKLPPNILIVLDASGSMNQDSANATCGTEPAAAQTRSGRC